MFRISLCTAFALTVLVAFFSSGVAQQSSPQRTDQTLLLIRPLHDQSQIGCGCYFNFRSDPKERCVFFSDLVDNEIKMNIDGRDVSLSLVKRVRPEREKVGSRSTETFQAPGIKVTARYVTTAMCAPGEENCESISYDGTFTVAKGKRQRTVKLRGVCGC